MISDRDDAYRREYEAVMNARRALDRPFGHGPITLAATVAAVVIAVCAVAWWIA